MRVNSRDSIIVSKTGGFLSTGLAADTADRGSATVDALTTAAGVPARSAGCIQQYGG